MKSDFIDLGNGKEVITHEVSADAVNAVKEHCAALRSAGVTGSNEMRYAATVPGWVILDWCNRKGVEWGRFMRDEALQSLFLDDPDNSAFRIWQGKI